MAASRGVNRLCQGPGPQTPVRPDRLWLVINRTPVPMAIPIGPEIG
jgi:hypothetical protein